MAAGPFPSRCPRCTAMMRVRIPSRIALLALAALLIGSLALACGDDDDSAFAIQGRDFAFDGVPEKVDAGTATFTFENTGTEFHEMGLARLPEGMTLQEALELESIVPSGILLAPPGERAGGLTVDLEPGSYVLFCFIENENGPHAFQGMVAQITVGAPSDN